MAASEFDLIRDYFTGLGSRREDVLLGVGDDAALLQPPEGQAVALCVDTMVAGVHFPGDAPAASVGHKALAVNLSDLAAMGAEPAWATLSLTLPDADERWIASFTHGFGDLARYHNVALVGGDLSRGPLSVSVQAAGFVPRGRALRRRRARPGDAVFVSGTLGDAALGLALWQEQRATLDADSAWLIARLHQPTPRVSLGRELRGCATAAIDLSDGLAQDLGHILQGSGVGAVVDVDRLPVSEPARHYAVARRCLEAAAAGGDDYELCFTVPRTRLHRLDAIASRTGVRLTRIGTIEPGQGLRLVHGDGTPAGLQVPGYRHFTS
ncbi:MAG: thiamine-phosphate kinase [Ectothiorhodospiraceae bacterium]|nr:thiamine-phosphate kinase [Ectothiorhodospiraceae bacterium]MCH8505688.1 thiamine-phosphate kinase [Ectothiorhodospiraceae bacterium]